MSNGILYVLLIIAIGYSVSECSRFRYRVEAASGYRQYGAILLYGALYVMAWTAIAYFVVVFAPIQHGFVYGSILDFFMKHTIYILSAGLGSTLFFRYIVNTYDRNEKNNLVMKANQDIGDELNTLLLNSIKEGRLMLLALDNGRLYLGWAVGTLNPSDDREHQYIRFLPIRIGYRTKKQKDIFVVNVSGASFAAAHKNIKDFEEIIPRKSIKSAKAL